jgi:hypothetical protein
MHLSSNEGPCECSGPVSRFHWSPFQYYRQRISILVPQVCWIEDVRRVHKNPSKSILSHPPAPSSLRALTRLVPLSQRAQQLRPRPLNHIQIDLIHQGRTITTYPLVPSLYGAPTLFRRFLVHQLRIPPRKRSSHQLGFIQMTLAISGIEKGLALALRPLLDFEIHPFLVGTVISERQIYIENVALVSR